MHWAFDNIHDFFLMGHHGIYVWSAWLITLVGITLLIAVSVRQRRQFYRQEMARITRLKSRASHRQELI